jgi:hypothetical protein
MARWKPGRRRRAGNLGRENEYRPRTVLELVQRAHEPMQHKLASTNEAKQFVRHVPSLEPVTEWVEQAGQLTRVVSY